MDEDKVRKAMDAAFSLLTADLSAIRTGRATPALVEDIMVAAYGGQSRLHVNELATITAPDNQTIQISPFDRSIIGEIKQGILAANVGLSPVIDGEIIRISLPPLTTEDREKYVRLLHTKLENAKIMIRQARGDAMRDIKRQFEEKVLSEDERTSQEKELQKLTDEFVGKIDAVGKRKETELSGAAGI